MPESWKSYKSADRDCFSSFLKRHPDIAIRQPEETCLARCVAFNKINVDAFFDKQGVVLDQQVLSPSRIYNTDKTVISTVLKVFKVVAPTGTKQVGSEKSSERGEMVTLTVAVNAVGCALPPMFMLPRKTFKDRFIKDGPADCVGTRN